MELKVGGLSIRISIGTPEPSNTSDSQQVAVAVNSPPTSNSGYDSGTQSGYNQVQSQQGASAPPLQPPPYGASGLTTQPISRPASSSAGRKFIV